MIDDTPPNYKPFLCFDLSYDQAVKAHNFIAEKEAEGHYLGAIRGGVTYAFTDTDLGRITQVIWCQGTKMEATCDLTDYSEW